MIRNPDGGVAVWKPGSNFEVRLGAEDYADEVLGNLEINLDKFLAAVRRGRERLQGRGADDELQP